ncbi:DUF3953 domain-containing protein [Planomicrobium sp. CPCC 101079]|uniref:DUF3953 domain-containing protein n=1 Tax=Planomicrobium sp. CPCC 101079 TaxID=2599618 RepID=UPI0011B787B7|nr:DUF3953 domain-containing protein [Planomicrobium sp. CPCC 101079]TWT09270.1 DUF3953 domain-containing protein [Planomicrobium sp. CPCC 101079]
MVKVIRITLQFVVIIFSLYVLAAQNFTMLPFVMLALGALMLVAGFEKIQKERKEFDGYVFIAVSLFIFFVAVQGYLLKD